MIRFSKYHALGNDYLVLHPRDFVGVPSPDAIRCICHRNFGLGSDGILFGPLASAIGDFGLRIFNPDGSEAEKSGNGLRIFSRYLWDCKRVGEPPFTIDTPGGLVTCEVSLQGDFIKVEMGRVSFLSSEIPVAGEERNVMDEKIVVDGEQLRFYAATIGNPHCVVPLDKISRQDALRFGPILETHEIFPNRTNVQFLRVLDRRNIQIEIWERGAGYTLASGSSSSAAAAVARCMGKVESELTVHMPGGKIAISISPDYDITMSGPATRVGQMFLDEGVLKQVII